MTRSADIAVLIVCHNGRRHLPACLDSVLAADTAGLSRAVVVVDNASTDDSVQLVLEQYPQVELIVSAENLGFAGGNNLGWRHILGKHSATRWLVLLNQDVIVARDYFKPLLAVMDAFADVAAVQPKITMWPDTTRLNTIGNRSHFLGFGFTTACGEVDGPAYSTPADITFASGAAVMLRADVIRQLGLFDPVYFMYLEDAELGWRLRRAGWRSRYEPAAVVHHAYEFRTTVRAYEHLERNRWLLMLRHYHWRTLLVLLPALLLMELGQWLFAAGQGLLPAKLRSYRQLLSRRLLAHTLRQRRRDQVLSRISDRELMRDFVGTIDFKPIQSPLVRWIANPIFTAYWAVARRLIV